MLLHFIFKDALVTEEGFVEEVVGEEPDQSFTPKDNGTPGENNSYSVISGKPFTLFLFSLCIFFIIVHFFSCC